MTLGQWLVIYSGIMAWRSLAPIELGNSSRVGHVVKASKRKADHQPKVLDWSMAARRVRTRRTRRTAAYAMAAILLAAAAVLGGPQLAFWLSSPASAETIDGNRIVVIDGDTVALPCATPSPGCSEKIRFIDIDAPETYRPNCENERVIGLQAKARVATLLRGATVYVERSGRKDRYGRTLANLATAAGDVGAILMGEGLAVEYRAGAPAKADRITHWCAR